MGNTSFTEILTVLYNGNRGQTQQTAETIQYNTFDLSEEYDRQKQERLNYEALDKITVLCEEEIKSAKYGLKYFFR